MQIKRYDPICDGPDRLPPRTHNLPSNFYCIVLACLAITVLHLLSQAVRLSVNSSTISAWHETIVWASRPHNEALNQLAKEIHLEPLPPTDPIVAAESLDDIDVLDAKMDNRLPQFNPNSTPSPPLETAASDIAREDKGQNAGQMQLQITPNHAHIDKHQSPNRKTRVAPTSKKQNLHIDCNNVVSILSGGNAYPSQKCKSANTDNQTGASEHRIIHSWPLINIFAIRNRILHWFEGKHQAPKTNEGQTMAVANKRRARHKESQQDVGSIKGIVKLEEGKDFVSKDSQVPKSEHMAVSNGVLDVQLLGAPTISPQPYTNSTKEERLTWLRDNWDKIEILHTDDRANDFATRIDRFLLGTGTDGYACEMRFFMTWIAPVNGFGSKERLALQSVFKTHPSACVVILSRTFDSPEGRHILAPLTDRGFKVLAITPNVPFLLKSTPAEKWFKDLSEGLIDPGTISIYQNLSNLLRLAVLYKYGGIYIDNDIIVFKSFANFRNVVGAQSVDLQTGKWMRLNNAVMVFDKGHLLLLHFIKEFSLTFNGSMWGYNGPYLLTRVMNREPNSGVKVMDPSAFYPVRWDTIGNLFQGPRTDDKKHRAAEKTTQLIGHSFAIHLWNKLTRNKEVQPGSVMDMLFQHVCILCNTHTENLT